MADNLDLAMLEEDEEFVFMLQMPDIQPRTFDPNFPRFELDLLSDEQARNQFRFYKGDIIRLKHALQIPERIILQNRSVVSGTDALCILLRRFAYPNRFSDLERIFGRPNTTLSIVVNTLLEHIYDHFRHVVTELDQAWMDQRHIQIYADIIHEKGAPLTNCFGFVDGTVRPICRPTRYQRVCYNGHKRIHALKFQSVMLPNGIIGNMFGPVEGRRHDCFLLQQSRLMEKIELNIGRDRNGDQFALYGDPAYPVRNYLLAPYKGVNLTDAEQEFNSLMSSVRESVEWGFQKITTNFAFLDFKKNLKILLQPVGKYSLVGTLLTNCHTCMYGSLTGSYFNLEPPSLEQYLGLEAIQ